LGTPASVTIGNDGRGNGAVRPCPRRNSPVRRNSAQKLSTAAEWLRPPSKPLRALAEQVLRDVEGRSRFARRHAAALAMAVLDAMAGQGAPGADRPIAIDHEQPDASARRVAPAEGGPGLVRRSATLVMAEVATLVVDEPEVAASLLSFAGVAS
jgi:hypothetical protein